MNRNSTDAITLASYLQWHTLDGVKASFASIEDDGAITDLQLEAALPETVLAQAKTLREPAERRHFLFRRCFQLVFVGQVISWAGSIHSLPLTQNRDQRPQCSAMPKLCLSFSSSGHVYLFGAARQGAIGLDIERIRYVADADLLAERFFKAEEAALVAASPAPERDLAFLSIWSAKEAALKAIGRGIDSGLNTFSFNKTGQNLHVLTPSDPTLAGSWKLELPHWRDGFIVAVMHRSTTE